MHLKKEKEFQYHPGVEKILMDVIGGGTISRVDIDVSFGGVKLDELPPLTVVGKNPATGLWHVVKTAKIIAGGDASAPRVSKKHLLKVIRLEKIHWF